MRVFVAWILASALIASVQGFAQVCEDFHPICATICSNKCVKQQQHAADEEHVGLAMRKKRRFRMLQDEEEEQLDEEPPRFGGGGGLRGQQQQQQQPLRWGALDMRQGANGQSTFGGRPQQQQQPQQFGRQQQQPQQQFNRFGGNAPQQQQAAPLRWGALDMRQGNDGRFTFGGRPQQPQQQQPQRFTSNRFDEEEEPRPRSQPRMIKPQQKPQQQHHEKQQGGDTCSELTEAAMEVFGGLCPKSCGLCHSKPNLHEAADRYTSLHCSNEQRGEESVALAF